MSKSCCQPDIPEPTPASKKWVKRIWYGVLILIVVLLLIQQLSQ